MRVETHCSESLNLTGSDCIHRNTLVPHVGHNRDTHSMQVASVCARKCWVLPSELLGLGAITTIHDPITEHQRDVLINIEHGLNIGTVFSQNTGEGRGGLSLRGQRHEH